MRGRIVKGIGGFYYVRCGAAGEGAPRDRELYECRAKGIFRRDNRRPLVGDEVEMDVLDEEKKTGNISELLPRRSELIRPAVANVDQALVIFAVVSPKPNFNLLDRFLIMMVQQGLESIICFNKTDIDEDGSGEEYRRIYAGCGYRTLGVSAKTGAGIDSLRELLRGKTTAVAGPSGVGKSSVINCLQPDIVMETGEISAKIQRGKHTTRHSELIRLEEGTDIQDTYIQDTYIQDTYIQDTYILDTPGFSSLGLFDLEKGGLAAYYPEFTEYEKSCRFSGCAHIGERDCGVKDAVAEGRISRMRYENYCLLYQELDYIQPGGAKAKQASKNYRAGRK